MSFNKIIESWYALNKRDLPWRNTSDPYKIWLSEVILQQTRVNQGMPYYEKFIEKYPDIAAMAAAPEDEILKLWQGLGYYSRARNMHHAAKMVSHEMNGTFPVSYGDILKLKGVGSYTAAAIASIAGNEPVAVVDGNVYRVIARYFGIDTPIDSTEGKKKFLKLANELISKDNPATYNQAVMEFGALQCKPQNPDCPICPLKSSCVALKEKKVDTLPVKSKKTAVKKRYFNYIFFEKSGFAHLQKRPQTDIWANLYEFPLVETENVIADNKLLMGLPAVKELINGQGVKFVRKSFETVHKLSHREIHAAFWYMGVDSGFLINNSSIFEIKIEDLHDYPVSRLTERFIKEYLEQQNS